MAKIMIPYGVAIRKFYRGYIMVDDGASDEEVREEIKAQILLDDTLVLEEDPFLNRIEENDILDIDPEFDGAWYEDGGEEHT